MPLRQDKTLWFNRSGIVAAYQPVRGPNSAIVRCNMARGGDNRYTATPGTAPTWGPMRGWGFNGSSTYLDSGVTPTNDQTWSMFVRFSGIASGYVVLAGCRGNFDNGPFFILEANRGDNTVLYANGNLYYPSPAMTSGVLAVVGNKGYRSGLVESGTIATIAGAFTTIYIGSDHSAAGSKTGAVQFVSGNILSVAVYSRTLSAAEVFRAYLQMAYCDVNPDWSVWARRRQWYIASSLFQAAWAARNNQYIGPGA